MAMVDAASNHVASKLAEYEPEIDGLLWRLVECRKSAAHPTHFCLDATEAYIVGLLIGYWTAAKDAGCGN